MVKDIVAITVGVGWIIVGLVTIGLAVPLVQGKVGRDALYGVRFRQSFESDEAWFTINRYGAWRMIVWALPMIAGGVATLAVPLQARPGLTIFLAAGPLIFVLVPALDTWRFAGQYAAG